jgi:hypothetical protein
MSKVTGYVIYEGKSEINGKKYCSCYYLKF